MLFSSLFATKKTQTHIAADQPAAQPPTAPGSLGSSSPTPAPTCAHPRPSVAICRKPEIPETGWFLPDQIAWLNDRGSLRIWEKSRQVGATKTDAFDSVLKASPD